MAGIEGASHDGSVHGLTRVTLRLSMVPLISKDYNEVLPRWSDSVKVDVDYIVEGYSQYTCKKDAATVLICSLFC